MARKKENIELVENTVEEIVESTLPIVVEEKEMGKIVLVTKTYFITETKNGNITIPVSKNNKNLKKGDFIEII